MEKTAREYVQEIKGLLDNHQEADFDMKGLLLLAVGALAEVAAADDRGRLGKICRDTLDDIWSDAHAEVVGLNIEE